MFYLIISIIVITFVLYKRYFPVFGAGCIPLNDLKLDKLKIIDLREYNESYKDPILGSINIPISYLKRNLKDIPNSDLHLIVTSKLEKNISTRYLRKKGYRIVGYTNISIQRLIDKENTLNIKANC